MDDDNTPPPNPDDQKPRRGGPPVKLTEDLILGICQCILDGNFRATAARRFGVHPGTLRRWLRTGRQFPEGLYGQLRSLLLEAEAEAERLAVKAIMLVGKTEDVKHLEWWLERKYPGRWGRYRGELVQLRREIREVREMLRREADDGSPEAGRGPAEG